MVDTSELEPVLSASRELGFLGPGPVEAHLRHAQAFLPGIATAERVLDLGAGGGVPGLVLAVARPDISFVLLDANERRVAFLRSAVRTLGLEATTNVVLGRAELSARRDDLRELMDVVVARSFGPPAVTAECAVGFLRVGGTLLVSEPPDGRDRWPKDALAELGLEDVNVDDADHARIRRLRRLDVPIDQFPRALGVPVKRPWFAEQ